MKLENAQNRSYPVIPIAVREEFSTTNATYRSEDDTVNVSFSELKYNNFGLLFFISIPRNRILKNDFGTNILKNFPKTE